MPGALKGMVVGFCNTLVVAFCIAMISSSAGQVQLFILVVMFGFLPGTLTGVLLGHFAAEAKNMHRGVLLVVMIALSCTAVALLGNGFDVEELVVVSCIPTTAACSILERWTREKHDLPAARVA